MIWLLALWKRAWRRWYVQRAGTGAISVGSGFALAPDDVVAPMHRDLGCYL